MAIRSSPYFNNPQFAQAASNLASLFEPPSGADAAGWATADAKRAEATRLAQLFDMSQDPALDRVKFDQGNIAAGNYTPIQSFYAQDQGNATAIRGQDVTASTSRMNNAADNARALQVGKLGALADFYDPLNEGQVRPELPSDIAGMYGVDRALPAEYGMPKAPSQTEWDAAQRQRLLEEGELTDQMILDTIVGEQAPVQAVGAAGAPMFMSPGAAVRESAQPFINKGAEAKADVLNYQTPDGVGGTAVYDPAKGGLVDTQTGMALPQGTQTYKSQAQGSAEDILNKPVVNDIDKQLIDIGMAKNTAVKLRDLIAASPASQGAVGWIRGTAQNLVQTGGELGAYFGGQMAEVNKAIQEGAADAGLAGSFDPNIPAIDMMKNLLAFQYAKTTTGERLSNEMLAQSRKALGLEGVTANQASALASIQQAIAAIESQEAYLIEARKRGPGQISAPAPAAPSGRLRFDADGNAL